MQTPLDANSPAQPSRRTDDRLRLWIHRRRLPLLVFNFSLGGRELLERDVLRVGISGCVQLWRVLLRAVCESHPTKPSCRSTSSCMIFCEGCCSDLKLTSFALDALLLVNSAGHHHLDL